MCATFVVYVMSQESGEKALSKSGLFLWKKALKHSKEYFVSDCLKEDRVSEKGVFFIP